MCREYWFRSNQPGLTPVASLSWSPHTPQAWPACLSRSWEHSHCLSNLETNKITRCSLQSCASFSEAGWRIFKYLLYYLLTTKIRSEVKVIVTNFKLFFRYNKIIRLQNKTADCKSIFSLTLRLILHSMNLNVWLRIWTILRTCR